MEEKGSYLLKHKKYFQTCPSSSCDFLSKSLIICSSISQIILLVINSFVHKYINKENGMFDDGDVIVSKNE